MQPASTVTPKKKTNKWVKGVLYTAFALAVVGHGYRDYENSQIRQAQEEIIQLQDELILLQAEEIQKMKQRGGESGGYCDDGFVIPDLKQRGPVQAKATKPALTAPARTI